METLKRWKSSTSSKTAATASSDGGSDDENSAKNKGTHVGSIPEDGFADEHTRASPSGPPLAGVHPSPSSSSGRLRIALLQSTSTATPGSILEGNIDVDSLKDCKTLKVVLTGKCACTIMGKMRYQAAIGVNALGSAGAGSAAPITFRESHTFLSAEQVLWSGEQEGSSDTATISTSPQASSSTGGGLANRLRRRMSDNNSSSAEKQQQAAEEKTRFPFTIDMPRIKMCTCPAATYAIPPTIDLRRFSTTSHMVDRSTIEVKYSISAVLDRRGLLRRKQKAKVQLEVLDDAPPGYSTQEAVYAASKSPFKYATADSSANVPELECSLSFVPPTSRDGIITYSVKYRIYDPSAPPFPSSDGLQEPLSPPPPDEEGGADMPPVYHAPAAPLLDNLSPRCEVTLNRASFTRPIERVSEGTEFQFPSFTIAQGSNDPLDQTRNDNNARLGQGEIRGTLKVPIDEVTMYTCGAEVSHHMQARLYSASLKRPVVVRCKVYLPSGR